MPVKLSPPVLPSSPPLHHLPPHGVLRILLNPTTNSQIQYSKYCNNIVPEPLLDEQTSRQHAPSLHPFFTPALFSGGDPLFNSVYTNSPQVHPDIEGKTVNNFVFKVEARLSLMVPKKMRIIERVVKMVAFLLRFRLLQLTWSARQGDGSQNETWILDRKVL